MTTFDDRENAFENKFAHDQELEFRINARTNKLLGLWAAEKLGLPAENVDAYARSVVESDFKVPGDDDVIEKVLNDLNAAGIGITAAQVRQERDRLHVTAKEQILGEPR